MELRLFIDVKNKIHDASGVEDPDVWYWGRTSLTMIYYPVQKLTEADVSVKVKSWMDEMGIVSIDEVYAKELTYEESIKRDWLLDLFTKSCFINNI